MLKKLDAQPPTSLLFPVSPAESWMNHINQAIHGIQLKRIIFPFCCIKCNPAETTELKKFAILSIKEAGKIMDIFASFQVGTTISTKFSWAISSVGNLD